MARSELEALYGDHLLDETEHGRYRFHDLVRDYGRSLGEDGQDGTMSIKNLAGHYLKTISAANTYVSRGSTTTTARFDSRPRPRRGLTPSARTYSPASRSASTRQHALVVGLAAAMAPYLRQAGPWDQAAELHRTAVVAARRTGDRKAEADALANLGMVSRLMARYRAAVEPWTSRSRSTGLSAICMGRRRCSTSSASCTT